MKLLSVIVPCYNEEETVADFYAEFIKNKDFFEEKGLENRGACFYESACKR